VSEATTRKWYDYCMSKIKAIIIPGNGDDNPEDKWFPYLVTELGKIGIEVVNVKYPDAVLARRKYWIPFLEKLGADENTILIGHSSGAVAAMRYAEDHKIFGSILVGACYTDLGVDTEKISKYYDEPWDWEAIKNNQKWIAQFASTDDPYIPIEEARHVHKNLETEYYEFTDQGHFGGDKGRVTFPEIVEIIKKKI
jgi:predicted alpha/beta hydrolase family esterase